ncbi:MAG TPA: nucleotidyltransferase family protein, partial [Micromonosporaceae bacterium]
MDDHASADGNASGDGHASADDLAGLRWAAGYGPAASDPPYRDESRFLQLVRSHALTSRLHRRLHQERPPWASPAIHAAVEESFRQTLGTVHRHHAAAAQIASRLDDPGNVILVKGISTWLSTAAEHTARAGDIDLVCHDESPVEVLTGLGYHQTRAPFLYEIGEYTRDDIEVDLHAYYPVHRYPASLLDADLRRPSAPGLPPSQSIQTGHQMEVTRLTHAWLRRHAVPGRSGGGVLVPEPDALIIMLGSHSLLNFVNMWSISHREKPYVRLGELADIADLAATPGFDPVRFWNMVDECQADHAVAWANYASAVLLGAPVLPWLHAHARLDWGSFPRCLWWDFWADLPVRVDLLVTPDWYGMAEVVRELGGAAVPVGQRTAVDPSAAGLSATGPSEPALNAGAWLSLAGRGPLPDWWVSTELNQGDLVVSIGLAEPSLGADRVRVDFGRLASEWCWRPGVGQVTVGTPAGAELA